MLVQALASYADTYLSSQLGDPAFEEKPVQYLVEISKDGEFLGIRERTIEIPSSGKKKPQIRAMPLLAPKSPVNRNGAVFPLLACDAIQYVLGPKIGVWTKDTDLEKHTRHHQAFIEYIRNSSKDCRDPALTACAIFYENPGKVEKANQELAALKPKDGALVALSIANPVGSEGDINGIVIEQASVRDYWRNQYRRFFGERVEKGGAQGTCLISGRLGPIAPTHDKIKGLASLGDQGGQACGVALMSFDKNAFQSYGWDKNMNSPVCPERAGAYVLAFNDLLRPGAHRRGLSKDRVVRTRFDLAGSAFIFWTRKPTDDDWYSIINETSDDQVNTLLRAPLSGKASGNIDSNDFYFVAVAGNGGRLLVRYWFHDSLERVKQSIRNWFEGLRIADVFSHGEPAKPPSLWSLLSELARDMENVPANRGIQLIRRAFHGVFLGRTILAAALGRLRASHSKRKKECNGSSKKKNIERLRPNRIALIRLCVNDIISSQKKGENLMTESLNPRLEHPAYICGRLLAIYESLQYQAQGEIGVSVVDRYYSLASTNPQVAFPKIGVLAMHHLKKVRRENRPAAIAIQNRLQEMHEILSRSNNGAFPGSLDLEDQGRFAIGFHHQKADDARRIGEAKAQKSQKIE